MKRGYIINPDKELLPDYKISPFSTSDITKNRLFSLSDTIDRYFLDRFSNRHFMYTINGRSAINIALQHYHLCPDDCVSILTTTGNFYISGCVTKEIEKYCGWSRIIEKNTKLIFVNHEFGYPFESLEQLKGYKIPIIEDCAHSFYSFDANSFMGQIGDFVIYSFPKMFPIQIGGLLVSNIGNQSDIWLSNKNMPMDEKRYIKNVLSFYIRKSDEIVAKRLLNYEILSRLLAPLNLKERFQMKRGIVPGVFIFTTSLSIDLLPSLKVHMYHNGIQCSVFYGENAFFIPVHQNLQENDFIYFREVISAFIESAQFKKLNPH